jgi:hypothetical protein
MCHLRNITPPPYCSHCSKQVLLARAAADYPSASPPPLRFIRSCSSALAPATLEKLENTFKVSLGRDAFEALCASVCVRMCVCVRACVSVHVYA